MTFTDLKLCDDIIDNIGLSNSCLILSLPLFDSSNNEDRDALILLKGDLDFFISLAGVGLVLLGAPICFHLLYRNELDY